MTDGEPRWTRRGVLGAAVALAVGCTPRHRRPPTPDPDAAALIAARAMERTLIASYAEGTPERAAHLTHLRALGGAPTAVPPATAVSGPDLRSSVAVLQAAAQAARGGGTAALLASIAASHAVLARGRA